MDSLVIVSTGDELIIPPSNFCPEWLGPVVGTRAITKEHRNEKDHHTMGQEVD